MGQGQMFHSVPQGRVRGYPLLIFPRLNRAFVYRKVSVFAL